MKHSSPLLPAPTLWAPGFGLSWTRYFQGYILGLPLPAWVLLGCSPYLSLLCQCYSWLLPS